MTTHKPGTFIAFLDVESLERRFPPFPDGSDGIFEPTRRKHGFFPPPPENSQNTSDLEFTDGSDAFFLPPRVREKKIKRQWEM
jgi:hypothetical protein